MHRRLVLLLTSLLALAVAAPVIHARPTRIDGRHQRGPRRIGNRARRRGGRRRGRRHHSAPHGSGLTGVYEGETSYPPPSFVPLDSDPYVSNFVLRVNDGKITGFVATVRMECPDIAILERHIQHVVFRGPALSAGGGLSFREDGVHFTGSVGANSASGSVSGTDDGCSVGSGATWRATKKRF